MFALKDLVAKGKEVRFLCLMAESLWYETDDGFAFPVPLSETAGATFLAKDKALLFMRHIRKHLPNATELVAGLARSMVRDLDGPVVRFSRFSHFKEMELWFVTEDGLEFPVTAGHGDTVSAVERASKFATASATQRAVVEKARRDAQMAKGEVASAA